MIKIDHIETYGWDSAVRGMRNPLNSWDKSDSIFFPEVKLGPNDLGLMMKLTKAGNDHAKFLRMITVTMDVTAPLYWLKEAETYKVGTVVNSCSTMHKISSKEFEMTDFSFEHLGVYIPAEKNGGEEVMQDLWIVVMDDVINALNIARDFYLKETDAELKKQYWWQMIQMLPSSYNQKRTVLLNYQVLKNIYHARKNHKLDEWHDFCHMIELLPYSEELIINV